MTDKEVSDLARDLVQNKVFMSDQISNPNDLMSVFMVLALLDDEKMKKLRESDVVACYEYMNRATARSVNGYPTFMSCRVLMKDDYDRVIAEERRMRLAIGEPQMEESVR